MKLINLKRMKFSFSDFSNLVVSSTTNFKIWDSSNDSLSSYFRVKRKVFSKVLVIPKHYYFCLVFTFNDFIPRIYRSENEFDFSGSLSKFSRPLLNLGRVHSDWNNKFYFIQRFNILFISQISQIYVAKLLTY